MRPNLLGEQTRLDSRTFSDCCANISESLSLTNLPNQPRNKKTVQSQNSNFPSWLFFVVFITKSFADKKRRERKGKVQTLNFLGDQSRCDNTNDSFYSTKVQFLFSIHSRLLSPLAPSLFTNNFASCWKSEGEDKSEAIYIGSLHKINLNHSFSMVSFVHFHGCLRDGNVRAELSWDKFEMVIGQVVCIRLIEVISYQIGALSCRKLRSILLTPMFEEGTVAPGNSSEVSKFRNIAHRTWNLIFLHSNFLEFNFEQDLLWI